MNRYNEDESGVRSIEAQQAKQKELDESNFIIEREPSLDEIAEIDKLLDGYFHADDI